MPLDKVIAPPSRWQKGLPVANPGQILRQGKEARPLGSSGRTARP